MFSCQEYVDFRSVRCGLRIGLTGLLNLIIEASIMHTESTDHNMKWNNEHKMGYILTNWQLKVLKYPKYNQKIKINTWTVDVRGMIGERSFLVLDETDCVIAKANTSWIFMDMKNRRPMRIPEEIKNDYGDNVPHVISKDYSFSTSGYIKINTGHYNVLRRDIDSNNHANNSNYLEWALEFIPREIYEDMDVSDMKISYKKECSVGDELIIETYLQANGDYLSQIKKLDGTSICDILTTWKEMK